MRLANSHFFFIQCHIGTNDAASYYTYLIEMRPIYYLSYNQVYGHR